MALGRLFVQMGRFLLKKQESNAIVHESVDGVAATFVLDVAESFKQVTREPVANFWPNVQQVLDHQEQKKTNQVDPQALNLYKLDASGALADTRALLRTEGLDHGACVAARNHDFLWRIEASTTEDASGDNVTLKHIVVIAPWPGQEERKTTPLLGTKGSGSDEASRNVQLHEFLQNFEARNPKDIPRRLPAAAKGAFFQSEAGLTLRAKAQICSALANVALQIHEQHNPGDLVDIWLKPRRKVTALGPLEKGAIVLAPDTPNVKVDRLAGTNELSEHLSCEVTFSVSPDPTNRFLLKHETNTSTSAFWFVGAT